MFERYEPSWFLNTPTSTHISKQIQKKESVKMKGFIDDLTYGTAAGMVMLRLIFLQKGDGIADRSCVWAAAKDDRKCWKKLFARWKNNKSENIM